MIILHHSMYWILPGDYTLSRNIFPYFYTYIIVFLSLERLVMDDYKKFEKSNIDSVIKSESRTSASQYKKQSRHSWVAFTMIKMTVKDIPFVLLLLNHCNEEFPVTCFYLSVSVRSFNLFTSLSIIDKSNYDPEGRILD